MIEEYKCAICGEIFEKSVSEEEALAELHVLFSEDLTADDCDIVCDDCWQIVRPDNPNNKEVFEYWQEEEERKRIAALPKVTDFETNKEFFAACDMDNFDVANQMIIPIQAEAILEEFKDFIEGNGKIMEEE